MKRFILGSLVLVIVLGAGIAQADFIDLPVKWSQMPQMDPAKAGFKRAEHPEAWNGQIVADDWLCVDPDPVVAVRWWGTYLNPALDPNPFNPVNPAPPQWVDFEIVFHSDDPLVQQPDGSWVNSQRYPYSTPLAPLSPIVGLEPYWNFVQAQEEFVTTLSAGPGQPSYNLYRYDAYLPTPFEQEQGTIYWIDIEYDEQHLGQQQGSTTDSWAWNTSLDAWNDKAVYGPHHIASYPDWNEFECHNMAFELMVPVPAAVILGILGLSVAGIKLRKYA